MALNAIIVEDEPLSRAFLNSLLSEHCPEINVLSSVATESEAIEAISNLNPDIVFLDIELQIGTGFDILLNLEHTDFTVIFTTALDEDALKTIKISGVRYLQKPVDAESLKAAIKLISDKASSKIVQDAQANLMETLRNNNLPVKIMIQDDHEATSIMLKDVIRIEANGASCFFYLKNGTQKTANKTLYEYDILLSDYHFFRLHNYHIINVNEIQELNNTDNASIMLSDGSIIPLSVKRKDKLISIIQIDKVLKRV